MAKKMKAECMTPDCKNEVYSRGICTTCYQLVRRMIKFNETSWDELERLGKAAKKKRPSGPTSFRTDWFKSK